MSLIWIFLPLIVILTKNIYFNETFSSMEQVRCFFFSIFHTVISPLLKGIIFLWNINHISIIKRIGRLISPLLRDNIDCGYRIFSCQYSQVTRITKGLSLKTLNHAHQLVVSLPKPIILFNKSIAFMDIQKSLTTIRN